MVFYSYFTISDPLYYLTHFKIHYTTNATVNPRLTKLFFVTRLTKRGVVTTPSLDFLNRIPYEIDFGINR